MTDEPENAAEGIDLPNALKQLPLFPLPQVVLFPEALLPLHVFEPRYRTMVKDALAGHQMIGVVQIIDTGNVDEHGHPEIANVAGAGYIVSHQELPGGRYNIMLRGVARVRLSEMPFKPPYRIAETEILETEEMEVSAADVTALISTATSFAGVIKERDPHFGFRLPKQAAPGAIADICAHYLILDGKERQDVLELLDVRRRVRLVTQLLATQQLALTIPEEGDLDLN